MICPFAGNHIRIKIKQLLLYIRKQNVHSNLLSIKRFDFCIMDDNGLSCYICSVCKPFMPPRSCKDIICRTELFIKYEVYYRCKLFFISIKRLFRTKLLEEPALQGFGTAAHNWCASVYRERSFQKLHSRPFTRA